MTLKLFRELRQDIDTLKAERDLLEAQHGVQQYRLLELIASIKKLNDLLLIKEPSKAQQQEAEELVNRMVDMARRDHLALLADERAVANLRKATGDD